MFSQGGPDINSLVGREPLVWSSGGNPLSTSGNETTGRSQHVHRLQLREPFIYFLDLRTILSPPVESCTLERDHANAADVFWSGRPGELGGYHNIVAFEQRRPRMPWAFAK